MDVLPLTLHGVLQEDLYKRRNKSKVKTALANLDVEVPSSFSEFYNTYEGPFWEEHVPYELLDMVEEEGNIQFYTDILRKEYKFPKNYLVLSELSVNTVLILDTLTDKVYCMSFEGEDEQLLNGELKASWSTFYAFLEDYFGC
ncbi:SMI1/KNR4 family protein [Priestia endophytica]|uniref:SMI1/KNR4 family protein n=1 Tax=Priestia endophytica TaxID=135735 RepID=UPI000DCA4CA2|nr:SMI1/KNR4 family protein [Priestia endophytica]RAS80961.1 1,3-beta-glucan synthase regulator [Priestia endophytica]